MGLADLILATTKGGTSLKKILKEKFITVEEVPFLTSNSYIRSSSFPSLCPREEVLCAREKVTRTNKITADLNIIFQHGHGLHHQLQNEILPSIGVMRGTWICNGCCAVYGKLVPGVRVEDWAVARPDACASCKGNEFRFEEADLIDEYHRITGHCDGFLVLPGMPGMGIVEGKSVQQGWEVQNTPKLDHVLQLQTYLWLTGLKWGIVLYWQKGEHGVNAFIEHLIERDEETILNIKSTLRGIWDGVAGGALPTRICEDIECPRAKACKMKKLCFEMSNDEPNED